MKRAAVLLAVAAAACGTSPPLVPDAGPLRLGVAELELVNGEIGVTGLVFVPDSDELLVLEKMGRITHYRMAGDTLEVLGELVLPSVRDVEDCGLLSAVFDPVTSEGRYLYLAHCVSGAGVTADRVVRLDFQPPDYDATLASLVTVIEVDDPEILASSTSHNLGRLTFDGDDQLLVPMGDRSVRPRSPDPASNLGKLLRIVPVRTPGVGGYTPAPGNPFADTPGASPDVYAIGLRHPWTISLDRLGRIWVGDVGSATAEEIDLITEPGQNFGWPAHEGPCTADCDGLVDPVLHWTRGSGHPYVQGDPEAVPTSSRIGWVGPEVRPHADDPYAGALDGSLLYGEVCVGFLRMLRLADDGSFADEALGHLANVIDMDQGPDGFVYALTYGSCLSSETPPGRLWRLVAAPDRG